MEYKMLINCNFYKKYQIVNGIFLILFTLIIFIAMMPDNIEKIYLFNYLIDLFCVVVILFMLTVYINKCGFDLFDPLFIVTLIYATLYFIAPIHDIIMGEYKWFGYNLFPYGVKASLIALVGYISFFIFKLFNLLTLS